MSGWDAYKATLVGHGFKVGQAIIAKDGGAPWTSAPPGNPQELKAVADAFKTPGSLFATGLRIGGKKYTVIRHDEEFIVAKIGNDFAFVAGISKLAIVIGIAGNELDVNNGMTRLGKVVDYLKTSGN